MAWPAQAQFPLPDSFNPGPDGDVQAVAVQTDGKILVGGNFRMFADQMWSNFARLNADGTIDTEFKPEADSPAFAFALQCDQKILAGGFFTMIGGQQRNRIARLHPNGALDTGFDPGADGVVLSIVVQTDGKILVAGTFTTLGGQPRSYLGRLNADGTLDSAFNPGADYYVISLALQPDGRILVGGEFTMLGGQSRAYIGRLNPDGTLDLGFNPGANGFPMSLAVQADGKILVGGSFTTLGGQLRNYLGRLHANGTLDLAFDPGASGPAVDSLAVQADGKILVGGWFTTLGGQARNSLGRLNADGTLDLAFNAGVQPNPSQIWSLALQGDGKILVGGFFSTLGAQSRNDLGRLNNTELATQGLAYDGSAVTWLRSGTSPEVWRTTFEFSTDGITWTNLGAGTRIVGGWHLTGVSTRPTGLIRARGFVASGDSWLVENTVAVGVGAPILVTQPQGGTNIANATVSFTILAGGAVPLAFEWLKDGRPLVDGGKIAGATTATLILTNVLKPDEGAYSVIVTNSLGSVTSAVVALTVIDPALVDQPLGQVKAFGESVTFGVTAAGTAPFAFRWFKSGMALPDELSLTGTKASILTVPNVSGGDAGNYTVVVTNSQGSVTSAVARLTVLDPVIISEPASQVRNVGQRVTFNVMAVGTIPLSYQWLKDGIALLDATNAALTLTNLQGSDAASYSVAVSNRYGSITSAVAVALLTINLPTVDVGFHPVQIGPVYSLALQPDMKILVGLPTPSRLNTDGTVDTSFNPGVNFLAAYSAAVQDDGKILAGGNGIARLNADGTLDPAFSSGAPGGATLSMVVQDDGKILAGGNGIARLNADGKLDPEFNLTGASGAVYSLVVQDDGKILVGGYSGLFVRLNPDGTRDEGFNPSTQGDVNALILQADGKIVVGGYFTMLGGEPRANIARLTADGTLDSGFNPGASGAVYSLALQADGKILVGGWFGTLDGLPRTYIGRLNGDGTLDPTFTPGVTSGQVSSLALQADGKILIGGDLSTVRMNNTGPATQSLAFDSSTVIWLRGGTSPEVWRTSFDQSTNGVTWTRLGAGSRIPGGWQLDGVSLAPGVTIRARGHVTGGRLNGSAWFVETIAGPPGFDTQPSSRTNNAGTTAVFNVFAGGTEPLRYQWRKNGIALADGPDIVGATTATLTISNVSVADAGSYTVAITNDQGSVTSAVARLTVLDPAIIAQPASQVSEVGQSVTFSVTAVGTSPVTYQWQFNATDILGATSPSLTITNLQSANLGNYTVIVANQFMSVTSAVATLQFRVPPTIVRPPQSRTNVVGSDATFTVAVTNAATLPINYQWRRISTVVANMLLNDYTASFTISNVQPSNAATYRVIITNAATTGPGTVATFGLTVVTSTVLPAVTWISPTNGASFTAPASILLEARADDPDGYIERIDFYGNTTYLGSLAGLASTLVWSNVVAGNYSLTARAFDNVGASSNSVPVNITVFSSQSLRLAPPALSGAILNLVGSGGTPGGAYRVLSSPDLALPRANWTRVAGGTMDGNGTFSVDIPVGAAEQLRFYIVAAP
ncbi:MAG TPA: immunoglobulin domain-containing protein [Verrucomicrobiae bacterium]|nr:immunoglobulin domain-containing protein [Verrucomicrobiae bacterium]